MPGAGWKIVLIANLLTLGMRSPSCPAAPLRPNIIIIYSDDVGYGDAGCYGATKISTPNIDRLAGDGVRFTDAHSTASTCTPSRYSILTGVYAFRNKRAQILDGDAPILIQRGMTTLPGLLQQAGYVTACIGKWHLGLGDGKIDWNGPVTPGPLQIGFDASFIIPATPDRVPCVYLDGSRVLGLGNDPLHISYRQKIGDEPTGRDHPELLRYPANAQHSGTIVDHISRIGWMSGGHSAWWTDEEMAQTLLARSDAFLEQNKGKPFFEYLALNDVHVPRAPNPRFLGTSQCGLRGDAIEELDAAVGEVVDKLRELGLSEKTLVIFSSDNGPIFLDGYADGSQKQANGHKPAGQFRGGKYQIYEGGTRMPFITCWPGSIKPGVSDALLSQMDLLASLADLAGYPVPDEAGIDSQNLRSALLGETHHGRDLLVEQSPQRLALRKGDWKYIPGGSAEKLDKLEEGDSSAGPRPSPTAALYDLSTDQGELHNVIDQQPEVAAEMNQELQGIIHKNSSATQPASVK